MAVKGALAGGLDRGGEHRGEFGGAAAGVGGESDSGVTF